MYIICALVAFGPQRYELYRTSESLTQNLFPKRLGALQLLAPHTTPNDKYPFANESGTYSKEARVLFPSRLRLEGLK